VETLGGDGREVLKEGVQLAAAMLEERGVISLEKLSGGGAVQ
jgi:hypothetical protein